MIYSVVTFLKLSSKIYFYGFYCIQLIKKECIMQINFSNNQMSSTPSFSAIRADKYGRELLKSRIDSARNADKNWKELAQLVIKHSDNSNDIFITKGDSDLSLGAIIFNRKTNAQQRIVEGPLKIETPLEFIKRAISIGEGFAKNIRNTEPNNNAEQVLKMM